MADAEVHAAVLEQIRRPVDPEEYEQIRNEWKVHSMAEDARDIPGLISTLTPDCRYEVVGTGAVWDGHEGARRFYTELLAAFPDIHFDLQNIVIGPQGVWEDARVTATHRGDWLDMPATGEAVEFTVTILFPWDPGRKKFRGERVHFFYEREDPAA
jgi:predicted ester cyclase